MGMDVALGDIHIAVSGEVCKGPWSMWGAQGVRQVWRSVYNSKP